MTLKVLKLDGWPGQVFAGYTTREAAVGAGAFRGFNLAEHVGDDPGAVAGHRRRLQGELPPGTRLQWLQQVHGSRVVRAERARLESAAPRADGAWTDEPGVACAVLTADCLPILLTAADGSCVAAVHAGWRGLAAGVVDNAVAALPVPAGTLRAWLGPAIGPCHFRVGGEVREAFQAAFGSVADAAFSAADDGYYFADLQLLARSRLQELGVRQAVDSGACTACDEARFYSYRRDGETGRMAAFILRRAPRGSA